VQKGASNAFIPDLFDLVFGGKLCRLVFGLKFAEWHCMDTLEKWEICILNAMCCELTVNARCCRPRVNANRCDRLNEALLFSRVPEKPLRTTTGSREENKPGWSCSPLRTWYEGPLLAVPRRAQPRGGAEDDPWVCSCWWRVSNLFPVALGHRCFNLCSLFLCCSMKL